MYPFQKRVGKRGERTINRVATLLWIGGEEIVYIHDSNKTIYYEQTIDLSDDVEIGSRELTRRNLLRWPISLG